MFRYIILTQFLVFVLIPQAFAQSLTCTQILNNAEDDFEAGRLISIPNQLSGCLQGDNFTREQEVRAHKLLTLVYLFIDDKESAEASMIDLLSADPGFTIDPNVDEAELIFLYNKFRTEPLFRIGLKAGINATLINATQTFNSFITDETSISSDNYTPQPAIHAALTFEYNFHSSFEAILAVSYALRSYEYSNTIPNNFNSASPEDFNVQNFQVGFVEDQTWLHIPAMIRYTYDRIKIQPYAYLGISFDYLLSAEMNTAEREGGQTVNIQTPDLINNNQRNQLNYALIGGVGLKFPIRTDFLVFELGYRNGLTNIVDADNRFVDQSINFSLAHTDDNFGLDAVSASIGFVKSIYKPKKIVP